MWENVILERQVVVKGEKARNEYSTISKEKNSDYLMGPREASGILVSMTGKYK